MRSHAVVRRRRQGRRKCARRPKPVAWRPFCPSKVCDGRSLPPRRHRRVGHLSWDASRSRVFYAAQVQAVWVTCSRPGVRRFRPALAVFRAPPFPTRSRGGFILSCASRPSRVSRVTAGPAKPGTSPGPSSLIATSACGVHTRGRPKPASFRPRRFARPRRLSPPPASRVCFTPLPRPGFALQGLPSREAARARRPPLPSGRSRRLPALGLTRRLQETAPASRALLRSRIRGARRWVRPPGARYPPELAPSSGSSSPTGRTTFIALDDRGLSRPSSRCPCVT
jgi:hypothetical protein